MALWICRLLVVTLLASPGLDLRTPPEPLTIRVISHGWHAGIALDRKDMRVDQWPEIDRYGGRFVEVGWGEAAYYPARDPGILQALRAGIGASPSVLHVVTFDTDPARFFRQSEVILLQIRRPGFDALVAFIRRSYERDPQGGVLAADPPLYGTGRFYRARGGYHLFNNCNHWTGAALHAAGLPFPRRGYLLAPSIMRKARRIAG